MLGIVRIAPQRSRATIHCMDTSSRRVVPFAVLIALVACTVLVVPGVTRAAQVNVSMSPTSFSPKNVTINVGDTVLWTNTDSIQHTVTATDSSFNSGTLPSGKVYSYTFTIPGTYSYYCMFHGAPGGVGMSGTITVLAPSQTPTVNSSNPTLDDLRTQIQALLNKITQLQQQTGVGTGVPGTTIPSAACPLIGRVLRKGDSGDDVTRLQQFLARDPLIYPERLVTGYYGSLTEAAVRRWQTQFNIVSSGSPETTGYGQVGPRTAATMAQRCALTGGNTGGNVGGFIKVTPISGNAPLAVSVEATVNTVNSCAGALYIVDWGDGTAPAQIAAPAQNCQQLVQTLRHTYERGGTYQVVLSAGAHRTNATVTVFGSAQPPTPPVSTVDSVSASPNTGEAPLSVTFSGTVNSSRSCSGGVYTLDFGDAQNAIIPYPADACQALLYSVMHQYSSGGAFTARLLRGSLSSGILAASAAVNVSVNTPDVGPFTVTPGIGGNIFAVEVEFDIATPCSAYDLNWGDGSTHVVQTQSSGACAQVVTTKKFTHIYTQAGSHTITLIRDSRTDTAAITISSY